ncbi:alpha/beta fold hydrolase [Thioalkalivibrio sp. XN8]|uniref:alpha/beta hydrolase n=1 Tax=Thioalkalivibrio sp. XN8 TaxID=2712863 RepID=UPI0013EAA449|nr:alpha/beta fold hydrolase [Thioalkalivibrio sp. XN8]NGP53173.1 alpha/beta fold hydrolase [Thioalkalivibrio sp. XN8]
MTRAAATAPFGAHWILVAAAALLLQACSGPPLSPWHTETLDEEFTARKADEIRSFEDYLQLEERLFAQLEEKVYAQTGTGPEYALVRFSKGSIADPAVRAPNWNRSFELLPAADPVGGVLLLHGMSDSPYSLRALGEALQARGYQVVGLRLPGHGTSPAGLRTVSVADMAAAVRLAMAHLATSLGGKPVHLVGYSNGATLALDFTLAALDGAAAPVPASLVLVSPAVGISPAAALAAWKRRLSVLPGLGGLGWLAIEPEFDPYKYNSFATNAGEQVHRLTASVARRIAERERAGGLQDFPPTLVFKSDVDATVSTTAVVQRLLGRLAGGRHELVLFDINRYAAKSILTAVDPRSLSMQVAGNPGLPFAVTLVTNEHEDSPSVVARRQPPRSAATGPAEPLGLAWPAGVISLSHVALPFPPDDPLYGQRPPESEDLLFLGQMAIQGERGLLLFPADWLLRLRHNPFYPYLEARALDWISAGGATVE